MTRVSTLDDLRRLGSAEDGDVVYVGRKRAYSFEATATDAADGWRIVEPESHTGRWLRVENGAAHIQLGDPGFEAVPSLRSTVVSGTGDVLSLVESIDFIDGEHIALYGGGETARVAQPTMPVPVLKGAGGNKTRQYCCAAVDDKLAVSEASSIVTVNDGPDELNHDTYYEILFNRQLVDPLTGVRSAGDFDQATRHIILWRREGTTGEWTAVHGIRVNVWRSDDYSLVSAPRLASILDNGKTASGVRAPYLPDQPPSHPTRGIHYSRILSGGGSLDIKLRDPLPDTVPRGVLFHDAAPAIRNSLDAFFPDSSESGKILLGPGTWPLQQPLILDKRFVMEGQGLESTKLALYHGQYIHISNQHSPESRGTTADGFRLKDMTILYRGRDAITCGAPVSEDKRWPSEHEALRKNHSAYMRRFPVEEHWSGAAVVITASRPKLENVHVQNASGHGLVLYGWAFQAARYRQGIQHCVRVSGQDSWSCILDDGTTEAISRPFEARRSANSNIGNFSSVSVSGVHFGHGILCRGSDANASLWNAINVVGCDGWGFIDLSQHGHTLVAGHVSANHGGAYSGANNLQCTWFFNCYSESGAQKVSEMGDASGAVGGVLGAPWRKGGLGLRLLGRDEPAGIQPMIEIVHQDDQTLTSVGHPKTNSSELMRISSSAKDKSARKMKYFKTRSGPDILEYWGTTGYETSRITGVNPRGTGLMEFRRGILVGKGNAASRRILSISSATRLPAGPYHVGDLLLLGDSVDMLRPAADFAVAVHAWSAGGILRAGETRSVSTSEDLILVAVDVSHTDGLSGVAGTTEPVVSRVGETVTDNSVTWAVYSADVRVSRISATSL